MEFFALQTDLSGHDFDTAFRIAREEIGGPNGVFFWNGQAYNTLYKTEENELMDLGLLDEYQAGVANALGQIDGSNLVAEAVQVGLPDPPVITDEVFPNPVAPFATSPLPESEHITEEIVDDGEGSLWEALSELGQAFVELFSSGSEE